MATTSSLQQNTGVITSNWANGESGYDGQMNLNLRFMDTMAYGVVKDATITTPPVSPADGDSYLLPSGVTGAWAGKAGYIARWYQLGTVWEFFPPKFAAKVTSSSTKWTYMYDGTNWMFIQGYGSLANRPSVFTYVMAGALYFCTEDTNWYFNYSSAWAIVPNKGGANTWLGQQNFAAGSRFGAISPAFDMFTGVSGSFLAVSDSTSGQNAVFRVGHVSSNSANSCSGLYFSRGRGTFAAPSTVLLNDKIMYSAAVSLVDATNQTAPTFRQVGEFAFYAEENHASSASGSRLTFSLTKTGATAMSTAFVMNGLFHLLPGTDNTQNLGSASNRMSTIYAGTGTINTSDARMKDGIRELSDVELEASKDLGKIIRIYKFKDAIAEKGNSARLHVGHIAQEIVKVMETHGLDPFAYGFVCYDEWVEIPPVIQQEDEIMQPATYDDSGNVVTPEIIGIKKGTVLQAGMAAGNRYSIRYEELLCFIAAGQEQRLAAIEAKLGL